MPNENSSSGEPPPIISLDAHRRKKGLAGAVRDYYASSPLDDILMADESLPGSFAQIHEITDPTDNVDPEKFWLPLANALLFMIQTNSPLADQEAEQFVQRNSDNDAFRNLLTFERTGDFLTYFVDELTNMQIPPQQVPENVFYFLTRRRVTTDPNA